MPLLFLLSSPKGICFLPLLFLLSFPQGICCFFCLCFSCCHFRRKSASAFVLAFLCFISRVALGRPARHEIRNPVYGIEAARFGRQVHCLPLRVVEVGVGPLRVVADVELPRAVQWHDGLAERDGRDRRGVFPTQANGRLEWGTGSGTGTGGLGAASLRKKRQKQGKGEEQEPGWAGADDLFCLRGRGSSECRRRCLTANCKPRADSPWE